MFWIFGRFGCDGKKEPDPGWKSCGPDLILLNIFYYGSPRKPEARPAYDDKMLIYKMKNF